MDRQSIIENQDLQQFLPGGTQERERERERKGVAIGGGGCGRRADEGGFKVIELASSPKKHRGVSHPLHQVKRSQWTPICLATLGLPD